MSVQISCVELVSAIVARKGCQFAGWQVTNSVNLSGGKKCPYVGATKTADIGIAIGIDWSKRAESVGRDLGARQWGQRVNGLPLVVHTPKGATSAKLYITTEINSYNLISYNDCNGNPIASEDIAPWLVKRSESDLGNYADYSLESIKTVYRMIDKVRTPHVVDHSDLATAVAMF